MKTKLHLSSVKIVIAVIFFNLYYSYSFSQNNDCVTTANKVFTTLVNSIGNNFPSPPTLVISDEEKFVAVVSDGEIFIEKKALSILCSFSDSESAIAYILSHELAHYYLNHAWMSNTGLSYATPLGQFLGDRSDGIEERKIEETQADLFGGFFSQISGYNSLYIASDVLDKIYAEYNLPTHLKGYPTLDERKLIVKTNLKEIKKLNLIFEAGKLNLLTGNYQLAEKCYQHILNKKFTSREIYNNLGTVYLNLAINNFDKDISKFIYPVFYENNTRTEIKEDRNIARGDITLDPEKQLNLAINNFEHSVALDPEFIPARINLILCEMIKNKVQNINGEEAVQTDLKKINNIEEKEYLDIIILSKLLFSDKKNKIKRLIKNAGPISIYNYNIVYGVEENSKPEEISGIESYTNINLNKLQLIGINKPYQYASSRKGIKIKKKEYNNDFVYEINYSGYYLEINNKEYSTSKKISIGDEIQKIQKTYGAPDRVLKFGVNLYFVYNNKKIIFSTINNKIKNIILYL